MRTSLREIPLEDVDLQDLTFVITYAPDLGPLKDSIARVGVLCPPLLQKIPDSGRYRIVCGYKRLNALKTMSRDKVASRLASTRDDLRLFLLGLHENLGTRALSIVEKSLALDKLVHQFRLQKSAILREHLPALGLGSDPKTLDLYLSISELEDPIKEVLISGQISISTAHWLSALSKIDRLAFYQLVTALALGKNLQREFLTLLTDLSRIHKVSLKGLLEGGEIKSLVEDQKVQAPIRAQKIRELLFRRRYPRFSQMADRFEHLKKKLSLPPELSLTASPFFEGQDYRLTVTFRSHKQLSTAVKALQTMVHNPMLTKLLEFSSQKRE